MNCPCEQPESGAKAYRCERLGCKMTPHWCHLYRTDPGYRELFDTGQWPGQDGAAKLQSAPSSEPRGPGTHLKEIFAGFGVKTCFGCAQHARKMDEEGAAWCRENIETIADWLGEQAKKRKWPFSRRGAKVLIRWAIRRAEAEAARFAATNRR